MGVPPNHPFKTGCSNENQPFWGYLCCLLEGQPGIAGIASCEHRQEGDEAAAEGPELHFCEIQWLGGALLQWVSILPI